jgi:hypothetical protein
MSTDVFGLGVIMFELFSRYLRSVLVCTNSHDPQLLQDYAYKVPLPSAPYLPLWPLSVSSRPLHRLPVSTAECFWCLYCARCCPLHSCSPGCVQHSPPYPSRIMPVLWLFTSGIADGLFVESVVPTQGHSIHLPSKMTVF